MDDQVPDGTAMEETRSERPTAHGVRSQARVEELDMEQQIEDTQQVKHKLGLIVRSRQRAQGLVEYGLAIGVVGVLAIAALQRWGTDISKLFDRLGTLIGPIGGG